MTRSNHNIKEGFNFTLYARSTENRMFQFYELFNAHSKVRDINVTFMHYCTSYRFLVFCHHLSCLLKLIETSIII